MQHPDEGTIHAWLDGALGSDDARAFETHVDGCPACAAAVSEARGLLAASSRILAALDAVPGGVLPAAAPVADPGPRAIVSRGSSPWRSPGLRAAAAIVLVGSVSWLATRSTQKDMPTASRSETAATAATIAEQATAPVVVQQRAAPDRETGSVQAPADVARSAPRPEVATPAPPSNAAPSNAAQSNAALSNAALSNAAPSNAAPLRRPAVPNGEAMPAAPAAPTAAAASAGAAATGAIADAAKIASGAALGERRAAAPRVMLQSTARMAREDAAQLVQLPFTDTDVQRLAGCYLLETRAPQEQNADADALALLPGSIELSTALDSAAGGGEHVLRPAPGAPPFAADRRATWSIIGPSAVKLSSHAANETMTAILTVRGDSLTGEATITSSSLASGTTRAAVRGARTACAKP